MKPQRQEGSQPQEIGPAKNATAGQGAGSPSGAEAASLPEPGGPAEPAVATLQEELRLLKDRYLRLAAAFDNFRKRTGQEAEVRAAAKKEVFILELLPVLDNLDRALADDGSISREQLRAGVEMISGQLRHLLSRHDIKPDDCLGQAFDPHRHEAIGVGRDGAQPDQAVLRVCRRGWMRGKEVLRAAQVIVNDLNDSGEQAIASESSLKHDESATTQDAKAQSSGCLCPDRPVAGDAV